MGLFSSSLSSVRKVFTDTFNRANQTPLGVASDGTEWENIRPGFSVSSNKASATNPAQYPLAAIEFPSTNVNISLSGIDQGSSAALWVTDSGNWWAVGIDQAPVTCNCQTGSNCVATSGGNCAAFFTSGGDCASFFFVPGGCVAWNTRTAVCTSWGTNTGTCRANTLAPGNCSELFPGPCNGQAPGNCRANSGGSCSAWNFKTKTGGGFCRATNPVFCSAWNFRPCNDWGARVCGTWNTRVSECSAWNTRTNFCDASTTPAGNCRQSSPGEVVCNGFSYNFLSFPCSGNAYNTINCTNWTQFTFGCQTCYPQYIRIIQSVSSTVTEIFNWTVGSIIRSLRVKTNRDQITIEAFSDDNHVTKIGSDIIFTPTGVAISPKFGIVMKPSDFNQGTAIDGIQITRN